MLLPGIGMALGVVPRFLLNAVVYMADAFASIPLGVINISSPPLLACLLLLLAMFFVSKYVLKSRSFRLGASAICIFLSAGLILFV